MTEYTSTKPAFSVLYVDDEEKALKYFQRAVGSDVEVHTATSVSEALEILNDRGEEIGVLVTDQRMPGQTGVDLLRRVRKDWPDMVRLLTTAYSDLEDAIAAVNRGEIFRYINKPWDIRQLRVELHQAMSVFELKRERSLLLEEKLSVWQRLAEVNRIRDLVVMAGSFTHVRHPMPAVAAFLRDNVTDSTPHSPVKPEQLDLWSFTEAEIKRTLGVVEEVIRTTAPPEGPDAFNERIAPTQLIDDGVPNHIRANVTEDNPPSQVGVHGALARELIHNLAVWAVGSSDDPLTVTCEATSTAQGEPAVAFIIPLSQTTLSDGAQALDTMAQQLAAYVIAYHHGGSLTLKRSHGTAQSLRLSLPVDPASAKPDDPDDRWLERVFSRLEDWD